MGPIPRSAGRLYTSPPYPHLGSRRRTMVRISCHDRSRAISCYPERTLQTMRGEQYPQPTTLTGPVQDIAGYKRLDEYRAERRSIRSPLPGALG